VTVSEPTSPATPADEDRPLELHRYGTPDALADAAAGALVAAIVRHQAGGRVAHVALAGGRIASRVYSRLGALVTASQLDPGRMELWWTDEQFVPTDDPARNAGHALAVLAGQFPLDPARTHPMPAADGVADNAAAAATYAKELGDTVFDICLLGLGEDGDVASIFPGHPSSEPTTHAVIAVNDAPKPPPERTSLSLTTLARSREVWFLVSGAEKADAVARALASDPTIPGGVLRGTQRTVWFLDAAAAARLPYYDCAF